MEGFEKMEQKRTLGGRNVSERIGDSTDVNSLKEKYTTTHEEAVQKYPDAAKKMSEWLKSIDSQEVREIFEEYAAKSGVPIDHMNFPLDVFFDVDEKGTV